MTCKSLTYLIRLSQRKSKLAKLSVTGYRIIRHLTIEGLTAGTLAGLLHFFF